MQKKFSVKNGQTSNPLSHERRQLRDSRWSKNFPSPKRGLPGQTNPRRRLTWTEKPLDMWLFKKCGSSNDIIQFTDTAKRTNGGNDFDNRQVQTLNCTVSFAKFRAKLLFINQGKYLEQTFARHLQNSAQILLTLSQLEYWHETNLFRDSLEFQSLRIATPSCNRTISYCKATDHSNYWPDRLCLCP